MCSIVRIAKARQAFNLYRQWTANQLAQHLQTFVLCVIEQLRVTCNYSRVCTNDKNLSERNNYISDSIRIHLTHPENS